MGWCGGGWRRNPDPGLCAADGDRVDRQSLVKALASAAANDVCPGPGLGALGRPAGCGWNRLAARPLLSNLIAGIQIALAQPIKLDDVVVVDGEWGRIEEFTATYVVVRLWDLRRLIVPLSYFLAQPFRNWTYTSSQILGLVHLYADYTLPIQPVREKCLELIKASPLWDGGVAVSQVVGADANVIQLRALMSSADSSKSWDLRCAVREQLIEFIQQNFPYALPKTRADLTMPQEQGGKDPPCPSGPATAGAADGGHGRARGGSLP